MAAEKVFNVRMTKELWFFLKRYALDRETSMNEILTTYVKKLKEKEENKLTSKHVVV